MNTDKQYCFMNPTTENHIQNQSNLMVNDFESNTLCE